jgi:hypothetical protein
LPSRAIDAARIHFYGHSLQYLSDCGLQWIRIHANWDVTIKNRYGNRYRIPVIVLCTRDRLFAARYFMAISNDQSTDDIDFRLDRYDVELRKMVDAWSINV